MTAGALRVLAASRAHAHEVTLHAAEVYAHAREVVATSRNGRYARMLRRRLAARLRREAR